MSRTQGLWVVYYARRSLLCCIVCVVWSDIVCLWSLEDPHEKEICYLPKWLIQSKYSVKPSSVPKSWFVPLLSAIEDVVNVYQQDKLWDATPMLQEIWWQDTNKHCWPEGASECTSDPLLTLARSSVGIHEVRQLLYIEKAGLLPYGKRTGIIRSLSHVMEVAKNVNIIKLIPLCV